jgi:D-serine deaminase-like pyridoxal phosphate-dependent protein
MRLSELPTPALCVDLDVLEANLETMHGFFRDRPCNVRPHFKAHKTPAIARLQIEAGGTGITCATVGEAEVLAAHGFDDLLIANEICDPTKVDRVRALAERIRLMVAVDSIESVQIVRQARVDVLVDVNVGMPRCGAPPDMVADVASAADRAGLRVRGVMGYEGHATIVDDPGDRAAVVNTSMEILLRSAETVRDVVEGATIVSAGSTLTYDVAGTTEGVTEIQAGSYALMDTEFAKPEIPFREALRCLTTVLSVQGDIAVLDSGLKALATDHGNPRLPDATPATVLFLSDEHTTLAKHDGFSNVPGDRMWLRPSHVDPTVNLHDRLYAYRGDEVEHIWTVEARGYRRP